MNKKTILPILFFGSLWGLAEAVLGYLLHLIPLGVSGFVMFPIGFYFMYCAYKKTNDIKSIFFVGLIASLIKLTDLALPFLPMIKTLIPCASIMFESLAVLVSYKIFKSMQSKICLSGIVFSSLGWRVLFIFLQYVLTLFGLSSKFIGGGAQIIISFILLEGLVNAAILFAFSLFANRTRLNIAQEKIISPVSALATFITAIGLTLVCSVI